MGKLDCFRLAFLNRWLISCVLERVRKPDGYVYDQTLRTRLQDQLHNRNHHKRPRDGLSLCLL